MADLNLGVIDKKQKIKKHKKNDEKTDYGKNKKMWGKVIMNIVKNDD